MHQGIGRSRKGTWPGQRGERGCLSWFSWTLLGLEHWSSAVKRSVQLSVGSLLSCQRLVEPLVLGGEVGEGGVQLLNCGHNILRGDSRARTKHLE